MKSNIIVSLILSELTILPMELIRVWADNTPPVPRTIVSLSSSDWYLHNEDRELEAATHFSLADTQARGWIPAAVPGNIQADLETAQQLQPLWYGAGDPRLMSVARKNWWYRKDFVAPHDLDRKRVKLLFDGVDHESEVWLNGQYLGRNAGMFKRFGFDVARQLKPGETNRLAVRIMRMPEKLVSYLVNSDTAQSGTGDYFFVNGINETRLRLKELKSPTNFGWDWGVNVWTLGIWKEVRLEITGSPRIEWCRVQTTLHDDYKKARVHARLEIDSFNANKVKAAFRVLGHAAQSAVTLEVELTKGTTLVEADLPLERPALWWPNGQGDQPLYTLECRLIQADTNEPLDETRTRFGVREVRWQHTEGAPADFISQYQLVLNGRLIRTLGSCMIPPDLLYGRIEPRGLWLIRLAQAAHMNMLRIWGGGVVLTEKMYDLADDLGILLSFEFPIANCSPEKDRVFLANLEATARNITKQVRNHPAIIEMAGGNEMSWNSTTQHPALQLLQRVVAEETDRLFRATCPDLGANHSPWDFQISRDYRHYNQVSTMRYGEFGAHTPAHLEVWHREIPPASQWPIEGVRDPMLIRKNVVQAVFSAEHWLLKSRLDDLFGPMPDLESLIRAGQFLGAEGLRYAEDALRRKGKRLGGFTSWDYNEPWPNGAGSFLIDYDGRPLMNYHFAKQALAPIALSLKYDSLLYSPTAALKTELWLASDAPAPAADLHWRWTARDRRGQIFGGDKGVTSIEPLAPKKLADIALKPPNQTAFGPLFIELQLRNAGGAVLGERLHVFGMAGVKESLGGLLRNREADQDDKTGESTAQTEDPQSPDNLAYTGNGAKPATASSSLAMEIHQPKGLNDGLYGNDHSWIASKPQSFFQVNLGKPAEIGRFKLGRDRTGAYADRAVEHLKIETSMDGIQWQSVYENHRVTAWPGFNPSTTMEIHIAPVKAKFIKVTVDPKDPASAVFACLDEFEVSRPIAGLKGDLPQVDFSGGLRPLYRPIRRTTLQASLQLVRIEPDQEVVEIKVANRGEMTALFCEPHPLIEYRTDLIIENNYYCVPPAEERVITIRATRHPKGGLTLSQTGWRLSCWNADACLIEPDADVLLAVGRRDGLCREFAGYPGQAGRVDMSDVKLSGRRPDPATLPLLLEPGRTQQFSFEVGESSAKNTACVRLHTADQSTDGAIIRLEVNGHIFTTTLAPGLGVQKDDPPHLAFAKTAQVDLPPGSLKPGANLIRVTATSGWITWDGIGVTALHSTF